MPGVEGAGAALIQSNCSAVVRERLWQALQAVVAGCAIVQRAAVPRVQRQRLRVVRNRCLKLPLHAAHIYHQQEISGGLFICSHQFTLIKLLGRTVRCQVLPVMHTTCQQYSVLL